MVSDKAVRGKYLFLAVSNALEFLRKRPTLAEVEANIELMKKLNPGAPLPPEYTFAKTSALIGKLTSMAYIAIHNYELGDHLERKFAKTAPDAR